jgi:hypothetical protein
MKTMTIQMNLNGFKIIHNITSADALFFLELLEVYGLYGEMSKAYILYD